MEYANGTRTENSPPPWRISIVIVAHNSAPDLATCLASLPQAAPRSRLDIIAVDNGSRDASADILIASGATVLREQSNIGFAAAVNKAMRQVDTPLALLLNPDVEAHCGAIDRLADAADAHPRTPVFGGRTLTRDGHENTSNAWAAITPLSSLFGAVGLSAVWPRSPFFNPEEIPQWDRQTDREVDVATGCALLVRTEVFQSSGGFDERYWLYGEEAEWQARLRASGYPPALVVSDAVFTHAKGSWPEETDADALRAARILRGRATLMRTAWPKRWRMLAPGLLRLHALRYGLQSLMGGAGKRRHRALWRTRSDWAAGYPQPSRTRGAFSRPRRIPRAMAGLIDPRTYFHAFRMINFWNNVHAAPRRTLSSGHDVEISPDVFFSNPARISIGDRTLVASGARLMAGSIHGRIVVGSDVMLGPGILVTAANYCTEYGPPYRDRGMEERDVVIEDGAWIGAGAVVLPGVTIGRGAIVGAGAVVFRSIPPGATFVAAEGHFLEQK